MRYAVRKAPVGAFYTAWRYRSAASVRRVSSVTRARRGFEVVVIGGRVPLPVDPRPVGPLEGSVAREGRPGRLPTPEVGRGYWRPPAYYGRVMFT